MRRVAAVALAALCAGSAHAHDFWLQPAQYWAQPGVWIPVTLQVGHGPQRQRSQIPQGRIARFAAVTPQGGVIDALASLDLGGAGEDGRLQFQAAGTYVVVLETDSRGRSALSAERFNAYVRSEGLTRALEQRERTGRMQAGASESYRRVTKALVQIGAAEAQLQSQVTTPLGLTLEIVPERSPYAAAGSAGLPVRVIFEGQPLAGALVKLTQLERDGAAHEVQQTDSSGRASFGLPQTGTWLLNVVWTKPAAATSEVDFETTFSSLSFGLPAAPAPAPQPPDPQS
ncbi:MAG: DUF4198 domain-containing protein [Pseudomonadota bacterium]|nr:DUF4198 domain-containing protein [Pseudomonadota bacterium]